MITEASYLNSTKRSSSDKQAIPFIPTRGCNTLLSLCQKILYAIERGDDGAAELDKLKNYTDRSATPGTQGALDKDLTYWKEKWKVINAEILCRKPYNHAMVTANRSSSANQRKISLSPGWTERFCHSSGKQSLFARELEEVSSEKPYYFSNRVQNYRQFGFKRWKSFLTTGGNLSPVPQNMERLQLVLGYESHSVTPIPSLFGTSIM